MKGSMLSKHNINKMIELKSHLIIMEINKKHQCVLKQWK